MSIDITDGIYNLIDRMNSRSTARGEQTVDGEKYSHSSKGNEWLIMIRSDQVGGVLTSSNDALYGSTHTILFDKFFVLYLSKKANI
ncbi:MAG: hypothetical protein ACK5YY_05230, partial [Alphaproteobacteria bacterium]